MSPSKCQRALFVALSSRWDVKWALKSSAVKANSPAAAQGPAWLWQGIRLVFDHAWSHFVTVGGRKALGTHMQVGWARVWRFCGGWWGLLGQALWCVNAKSNSAILIEEDALPRCKFSPVKKGRWLYFFSGAKEVYHRSEQRHGTRILCHSYTVLYHPFSRQLFVGNVEAISWDFCFGLSQDRGRP